MIYLSSRHIWLENSWQNINIATKINQASPGSTSRNETSQNGRFEWPPSVGVGSGPTFVIFGCGNPIRRLHFGLIVSWSNGEIAAIAHLVTSLSARYKGVH
jgi:hypothetical protein